MVYDKASDQWLPAYGKGSIRDLNKERNIIKENVKDDEDPFKTEER